MKADLELVRSAKKGDNASFSELVRRHERALLRLIWRLTKDKGAAEDVVQDTFIKAYQKLNLFEERSSFKSWLFRIGINTANNRLRSRDRDHVSIDNVHISQSAEAERKMVFQDLKILVAGFLEELPDRQRIALTLRIFDDLSFQEIAAIMECPYDTAKANYRHGLLKMKDSLLKHKWLEELTELEDDQVIRLKEIFTEAE